MCCGIYRDLSCFQGNFIAELHKKNGLTQKLIKVVGKVQHYLRKNPLNVAVALNFILITEGTQETGEERIYVLNCV